MFVYDQSTGIDPKKSERNVHGPARLTSVVYVLYYGIQNKKMGVNFYVTTDNTQ